ncbi:hypothetical protein FQR65_LT08278 [Abscondita terminalis]|nr:hypothetical protein FQR65_LT08278 [Abscondita terminalis]
MDIDETVKKEEINEKVMEKKNRLEGEVVVELASSFRRHAYLEIEASEENELCEKYNVHGFPYLILFRRGAAVDYYGERRADDIVLWIENQVRPAVEELHTLEETIDVIKTENVTIMGFYNNFSTLEAKSFIKIADNFAKPIFAITSNKEAMNTYNATSGTIILFEKYGNEKVLFVEELTLINMKTKIKPVARDYRKKITFLTINIDDEKLAEILIYFNVKPSDVPAIGLITGKNNMSKYRMKGPITTDNVRQFLRDFDEKKLSKILLSEQLPNDWNKTPIYTLVASNFVKITSDTSKIVVVYFYAMDCKSCPIWDPIVKKLGDYYNNREDVIVAKINVGANEFEETQVKEIPSIVLFKKGLDKQVIYDGNPKYDDIVKFIDSNDDVNNKNKSKLNYEL